MTSKYNTLAQSQTRIICNTFHPVRSTTHRLIAFPIDHSKHTLETIQWSLSTLLNPKLDLILLLHVSNPLPTSQINLLATESETTTDEANDLIVKISQLFADKGFEQIQGIALNGEVKTTLLQELDKWNCDLVVIGTKGENMNNEGLGSVAQFLGMKGHWPVTIVHPKPKMDIISE